MRSLRLPALRAAVLLLLLSACTGGDAPAGLEGAGSTLKIPISAAELPRGADAPALPINRIRATARTVPGGTVLGTVVVDVNPAAASWEIALDVDLSALPSVTVVVLFELIHVDAAGNESVQYSGRTDPIVLTAGQEVRSADLQLIRGPAANLDVTGIQINEPLGSILEGATRALAATVVTTGPAPVIFWSSLDPAATVTGTTATGVQPGTARIVASAGAVADTALLTVLPRPTAVVVTPDSVDVNDIGPEVTLTGVVIDRRGAVIAGQAVLWRTLTPSVLQDLGGGRFRTIGTGRGLAEGRAAADTTLKDVTVVRVRRPATDVALTKTGPSGQVAEGDVVEFSVRATNGSAVAAAGVSVTEALPEGLELLSATPSHGTFEAGVWTIGDMAPGASATLTVRARVGAGRSGQTLTNVVRLRPLNGQEDGNAGNNEARASVTVRFPPTDLSITKTVEVRRLAPRDTARFTITVTNHGPTPVSELVVLESPPEELVLLSGSPARGTFDEGTRRWSVGALDVGQSATLRVSARVAARGAGSTVVNRTRVLSFTGASDPNAANNSASAEVVIENRDVPQNRTLKTAGNTALVAGAQEVPDRPHVFSALHALTGSTGLTVTSTGTLETGLGGTVDMQADGKFIYLPPLGAGEVTDTVRFHTESSEGTAGSALLTFVIEDPVVWYVDNTFYGAGVRAAYVAGPEGQSLNPFVTLAQAEEASSAGDWIFVHYGDGSSDGLDDGVTLKDDQHLIGEGAGLAIEALDLQLVPPGDKPTLYYDDGTVIDMANGNTVAGLALEIEYGSAIHANNRTGGTISDVRIVNMQSSLGLDFYNVHGTWTVSDLDMESSSESGAVQIHEGDTEITIGIAEFEQDGGGQSFSIESTTGGFVHVNGATVLDEGEGLFIQNNAAEIEFHGPVVVDHPSNTGVRIRENTAHVYFPDLTVTTDGYVGIEIEDNQDEVEIDGSVHTTGESGLNVYCDPEVAPCGPVELVFSEFVVANGGGTDGRGLYVERSPGLIEVGLLDVERDASEFAAAAVEFDEAVGMTFRVTDPDSRILNTDGDALSVASAAIEEPVLRALAVRGPRESTPGLARPAGRRARVIEPLFEIDAVFGEISANGSCTSEACAGIGLIRVGGTLEVTGGAMTESETAIRIEGSDVDFEYGGSITHVENGRPLVVAGNTGGRIVLSGPIASGVGGVEIYANSDDTEVVLSGGLDLSPSEGAVGLYAEQGGTLEVTGANNSIVTDLAPAVVILDTEIGSAGVTLDSIYVTGSGLGIGLQNTGTAGRFKVTGDGSSDSGGSISGAEVGVYALYETDFEIEFMDLEDNVTSVALFEVSGRAHIEDSDIEIADGGGVFVLGSEGAELELVMDGNDFTANVVLEGGGAALVGELVGDYTASVSTNDMSVGDAEYGVEFYIAGGSALDLTVTNSDFNGVEEPIYVYQSQDADVTYEITGNTFDANEEYLSGGAIYFDTGVEEVVPTGIQKGRITGNEIVGASGGYGIVIEAGGEMDAITVISGQTMDDGGLETGVQIQSYGDAQFDVNILSNLILGMGETGRAVDIDASDYDGVTSTCLRLEGNTLEATSQAAYVQHDSDGTFKVRGISGGTPAAVVARIESQNTIVDGTVEVYQGETASAFVAANCRTVAAP